MLKEIFQPIAKATAGSLVGAASSIATSYVVIPDSVSMPWYGYVIAGVLNAVLGFASVYFAPRNVPNS